MTQTAKNFALLSSLDAVNKIDDARGGNKSETNDKTDINASTAKKYQYEESGQT